MLRTAHYGNFFGEGAPQVGDAGDTDEDSTTVAETRTGDTSDDEEEVVADSGEEAGDGDEDQTAAAGNTGLWGWFMGIFR